MIAVETDVPARSIGVVGVRRDIDLTDLAGNRIMVVLRLFRCWECIGEKDAQRYKGDGKFCLKVVHYCPQARLSMRARSGTGNISKADAKVISSNF